MILSDFCSSKGNAKKLKAEKYLAFLIPNIFILFLQSKPPMQLVSSGKRKSSYNEIPPHTRMAVSETYLIYVNYISIKMKKIIVHLKN